jgi:RNA polymerase sigma-70 factor (family 1)
MRKSMSFHELLELQKNVAHLRDELSYKKLFLHFHKPLLELACSFTGSHETAEEIVCDVMMKVWTMKEALLRVNNLKLYLYQGVRNTAINELKKSKKHAVVPFEETEISYDHSHVYNPEEILLKNELTQKIALSISQLPPKCRLVYRLVREEGFSYKEVAGLLGISVNTVDRHLNNALHKLMAAVKEYFTC